MSDNIGGALVNPRIAQTAIPILTLGLLLFFLFTGAYFFPDNWAQWQPIFVAYLFMSALAYMLMPQSFQTPALAWLMWFGVGTAAGLVMFTALRGVFTFGNPFPAGALIPLLLFQFTVASSEEAFFRGLLSKPSGRVGLGIIVSAVVFAGFHVAAYAGLSPVAFIVAFLAGVTFGIVYFMTQQLGLVTGLHMAYNVSLLLFAATAVA